MQDLETLKHANDDPAGHHARRKEQTREQDREQLSRLLDKVTREQGSNTSLSIVVSAFEGLSNNRLHQASHLALLDTFEALQSEAVLTEGEGR